MKNPPGTMKGHKKPTWNHKNQPGTLKTKNQLGTKTNRPVTMKNHKKTPGTMKNHVKPTWNYENPPRTMKNQPKAMKPTWTH